MLAFLRGKIDDRTLRLFACSCCRRIEHLFQDDRSAHALDVAERFAQGLATISELESAAEEALAAADRDGRNGQEATAVAATTNAISNEVAAAMYAAWAMAYALGDAAKVEQSAYEDFTRKHFELERAEQASILRKLAGNRFESD